MGNQHFLLVLSLVALSILLSESVGLSTNSIQNDDNDDKHDTKISLGLNPKFNKMLPEPTIVTNSSIIMEKKQAAKIPLAEDLRYNKMLPEKFKKKYDINVVKGKTKKDFNFDDDEADDDYDEDYYEDDDLSNEKVHNKSTIDLTTTTTTTQKYIEIKKTNELLKPIKVDNVKSQPKNEQISKIKNNKSDSNDNSNDDDDSDENDEDIEDEEEVVFSENVPCPRDCICARNANSYLVATCSRLDADVQKFGSDITDLVVVDVGPKYPIFLGPEFFLKIGLKHVSSIKISNCTIEYIDVTAFNGLQELYSVNLTNVGLTTIHPDIFKKNPRLRLLTISGNDLSQIVEKNSPNFKYILKSSSLEEIDLSNNNLNKLPSTAFNELQNIVYISLAQNNLKTLPELLFDSVDTIEELDLSFNSISTLPPNIFNKTALAILHLKYNDITNDLRFGTSDLQQLDLSFCSIKHITNFMFHKMDGLTNLNLKGNGLIKIQTEAFSTLRNLRSIDLSMNDLEQVSSLLFLKNSELDVIRLNDNPRLSQLPTDGFQSATGSFNVHYFDVSNCAIGALGFNTFSTMRQLTTLKLSWNNINNLDKLTFTALDRLTELDLSNNLIVKLDDLIFIHNRDLTKLNLAGNPIKKLSIKLFLPFTSLKELDVSECELHTLLSDNYFGNDNRFKLYDTLRTFNASFNQIKKITKDDVQYFKNLKTLDIMNNPLKCTDDFRSLMKYLAKKEILSRKVPTNSNLQQQETVSISLQVAQTWIELTKSVCKRAIENFKPYTSDIIDTKIVTKDEKFNINKIKDSINKNLHRVDVDEDTSIDDDGDDDFDEDDSDEGDDDNDNEYNEEDDYDEESEDSDTTNNDPYNNNNNNGKVTVKDKGLFADEIDLVRETKDKFLRGKLGKDEDNDDDDDDDDADDIDIGDINVDSIYYTSYKFILPLLFVLSSAIIILLLIGKIVSMMMKKRGERYRQALLASKNSIVYQKLSEEIIAPQTPKIHRYTPINQV